MVNCIVLKPPLGLYRLDLQNQKSSLLIIKSVLKLPQDEVRNDRRSYLMAAYTLFYVVIVRCVE